MAYPVYMKITGANSGEIKGSVEIAGREGMVEVLAIDHKVWVPSDPKTGLMRGTRKHGIFKVTKEVDNSSSLLFKLLCNSEDVEVEIKWYRVNEMGEEEEYYTHTLRKGRIVHMSDNMEHIKNPINENLGHLEVVGFSYTEIEWTYQDGGLTYMDSWISGR